MAEGSHEGASSRRCHETTLSGRAEWKDLLFRRPWIEAQTRWTCGSDPTATDRVSVTGSPGSLGRVKKTRRRPWQSWTCGEPPRDGARSGNAGVQGTRPRARGKSRQAGRQACVSGCALRPADEQVGRQAEARPIEWSNNKFNKLRFRKSQTSMMFRLHM